MKYFSTLRSLKPEDIDIGKITNYNLTGVLKPLLEDSEQFEFFKRGKHSKYKQDKYRQEKSTRSEWNNCMHSRYCRCTAGESKGNFEGSGYE